MSRTFDWQEAAVAAAGTLIAAVLGLVIFMAPHAHAGTLHHHASHRITAHHFADGRPSAWCGWEMRRLVRQDPGPSYNLARNWAHWGRSANGPAPGVIGVLPHHVFKVIAVLGRGTVLAISGNDSHAVRTRPRSTAGVIAWRVI